MGITMRKRVMSITIMRESAVDIIMMRKVMTSPHEESAAVMGITMRKRVMSITITRESAAVMIITAITMQMRFLPAGARNPPLNFPSRRLKAS